MENKKYRLTDVRIEVNGHILRRIQALKDFNDVEKGELGGFIESEENLSQEGDCWITGVACVYEHAKILDSAVVYDNADVRGNAIIKGKSFVYGGSRIYDNAQLDGCTNVRGSVEIYENAILCGNIVVEENAIIKGNSTIEGFGLITDSVLIEGDVHISGEYLFSDDALIRSTDDYIIFSSVKLFGNSTLTFYQTRTGLIGLSIMKAVKIPIRGGNQLESFMIKNFKIESFYEFIHLASSNYQYKKELNDIIAAVKTKFNLIK